MFQKSGGYIDTETALDVKFKLDEIARPDTFSKKRVSYFTIFIVKVFCVLYTCC